MKESKNPNSIKNKIRKVTTRFLENVVGGKGGETKQSEIVDNDHLLADIEIGNETDSNKQDVPHSDSKNNTTQGGAGDEQLKGGSGNDQIRGGQGDDTLKGGSGDDKLIGGLGDDLLNGGSGDDILLGGLGDDILTGGSGNDLLQGGHGDDIANGGSGDDILIGAEGNDSLRGGSGADFLHGGKGSDLIKGGSGDDVVKGGSGNDIIHGDDNQKVAIQSAGENLLKNPSFNSESDDKAMRDNNNLWSKPIAPEGWELTKGSGVEVINGDINKYGKGSNPNDLDGNYVELDGHNSSGIAQSIEAYKGQSYNLSFDFGTRDAHGGDNKMEVFWEGTKIDTIDKQAKGGVEWSTHEHKVTAGDPAQLGELSGKLEFRSIGDNDKGGELLDNVSLMVSDQEKSLAGGDDILHGGAGDDRVYGGIGDDIVKGGSGEDKLVGGQGDDVIHGGTGDDVLIGDGFKQGEVSSMTVENIGKASAGYHNSYGYYEKDSSGSPTNGQIIWADVKDSVGDKFSLEGIDQSKVGFFLIPNGDNVNSGLKDGQKLSFQQDSSGKWSPVADGEVLKGQSGAILYSETSLNKGDFKYATDAKADGNQNWEDLVGGGDRDNNDVNMNVTWVTQENKSEGGDDILIAGQGNDILHGGQGDDKVWGGQGDDRMTGGQGNDQLGGGTGDDIIHAGQGNDTAWGGQGEDRITGGQGEDKLHGGQGDDVLHGGQGDDILKGGTGDDILRGGQGNDQLRGGQGDDRLIGGQGNDRMTGGQGDDKMHGGQGDDKVWGGQGDDRMTGGQGNDQLGGGTGDDIIHAGQGNDTAWGGQGEDRITGGQGEDKLHGGQGDDVLHGGQGDDILKGDHGDDVLRGGQGNDHISGGTGDDIIHGGSGDDYIAFGSGDDIVHGGAGDDVIDDIAGAQLSGTNQLHGGAGDDTIWAGHGDDKIDGGTGDDRLLGETGDDTIIGGQGDDRMYGGTGDDTFIYKQGDGNDTIVGGDGKDILNLADTTITKFATEWEIKDSQGNTIDVSSLVKGAQVDLSSIQGNGSITAPDGNKIDFNSLETIKFAGGGSSDDILLAGKGDDTLIGGQGDDFLKGGQGDDTFVYKLGDGNDVVIGNQGDDDLHFGDITIEKFSENWQVLDSEGNAKDLKEMTVDGKIDLALIKGSGTIVGPDGSEITVKSLETLSFEEEITPPPTPSSVDGLVHDGKITVTLGGEAFKGNPEYAIVVNGIEVTRGEIDWSKDTLGAEKLYGNEGANDVDNSQVEWKDISVDYDFSDGMPQKVEVRFLNDACGGHDPESGEWQDRNLIVDKIKVDGLSVESEGDYTTYGERDGMERMPWQGSLEFNMDQAYANQVDEHNEKSLEVSTSTDKESNMERVTIGEPTEVFISSFEGKIKGQGTAQFESEADGWKPIGESIEMWSENFNRDLGGDFANAISSASDGEQYIELNAPKFSGFDDCSGISREVATEAGKIYELSFDYSGRPGYDASVNTFELKIGNEKIAQYDHDMSQEKDHDWQKVKVEFVGTGEPMSLQFQETSENDETYGRGISLDNIVLVDTGVEEREKEDSNSDSEPKEAQDIANIPSVPSTNTPDSTPPPSPTAGPSELPSATDEDTIKGTPNDDTIVGTQGDDIIKGGQGDDVLEGGQGDDIIIGGEGSDILKGGDGDDALIGDSNLEPKVGVPIGENLIVNGSFENHGDLNRGSWGIFDKIEGWQSSEGNIEIQMGKHGGTPGAAEGDSVLELDAHEGRDTNASVFQDVRTGTDGTFKLSFSFSAREIGSAANTSASNTTEVYWGSEKLATISADQKGWVTHEFDLSIDPEGDETTRLEFRGTGKDDGIGGLIDNVSLMRID
jgi:Ca2+-binding RTX toxin-like protein